MSMRLDHEVGRWEGAGELVVAGEVVQDVGDLGGDAAVDAEFFVATKREVEEGEGAGVGVADGEGAMRGIAEVETGGGVVATGDHDNSE